MNQTALALQDFWSGVEGEGGQSVDREDGASNQQDDKQFTFPSQSDQGWSGPETEL